MACAFTPPSLFVRTIEDEEVGQRVQSIGDTIQTPGTKRQHVQQQQQQQQSQVRGKNKKIKVRLA